MRTITVSSKNQVTIPVAILREVGISPGDRLAAAVVDGDIVLMKEPEDWMQYLRRGRPEADTEESLLRRQSRTEPASELPGETDPREWRKRFEDLYATDSGVRAVADTLMDCPYYVATFPDLAWLIPENGHPTDLTQTLERLTASRWVRRIPAQDEEPERYRLDGEIAASLKAAS